MSIWLKKDLDFYADLRSEVIFQVNCTEKKGGFRIFLKTSVFWENLFLGAFFSTVPSCVRVLECAREIESD
jgi:hypothetical protein